MVDNVQLTDPILATELTLQSLDEWLEVIFTKITDWSAVQYEEGDTTSPATGTAMLFRSGSNLRIPSTTYRLPTTSTITGTVKLDQPVAVSGTVTSSADIKSPLLRTSEVTKPVAVAAFGTLATGTLERDGEVVNFNTYGDTPSIPGAGAFQLVGAWTVGNIEIQASNDNTNWHTVFVTDRDGASHDALAKEGIYFFNYPAIRYLRARAYGSFSGRVDVFASINHGSNVVSLLHQLNIGNLGTLEDNTDTNRAWQYDPNTTPNTEYFGWAEPGVATSAASWKIKRIINTSGALSTTWADGDDVSNNVWDNRASLTYT